MISILYFLLYLTFLWIRLIFASRWSCLAQLADVKVSVVAPFSPPVSRNEITFVIFFSCHQVNAVVLFYKGCNLSLAD